MRNRKRFGELLSSSLLAAFIFLVMCVSDATAAEFRGFWVDAWGAGFLSQSQVDTLLGVPGTSTKGQIRDANCNAIVMQVRRNCDANYPSSMGEPYMSGLSPSNFNALQAVINAAHDTTGGKKRIEVHVWMVAFRTSGGAVYAAHSSTPTGSLTNLDNYWPSRDSSGAEVSDKAFDPGHPLVEEYTVNVAMDLVNNFDIDGIHYDYIRFTANDQGYNPTSIARYNTRYGLSGQPAASTEQFKQWRRDQVTAVVRKVYAKIQSSKPWVKQSGAFVTWNPSPTASTRAAFQNTRPYYDVYCDWDSWLQEGIVDAAMPMTYYDLGGSYLADWTRWINWEKDRHGNRHMYIGPGNYLNSLSNSITALQQTRTASPAGNYANGFCGYSYRVPYDGGTWAGFSPSLISSVTPTWADIPTMPWKTAPTKGHISGTVTIAATGAWSDGIYGTTVSITGPETRSMRCDGTGFYAFIDLTPGTYTVTASRPGYDDIVTSVTVGIGSVTGNMYVTDFALGSLPKPVISNVQATGITTTTATISWNTDLASSSQVQYGLTTSYGSSTTLNPSMVTSHTQGLSGLSPGTLYHYRVLSANANGTTTSSDYTFTTVGPPIITNVSASGITNNAATVTWTTDQGATSQVQYGLTTSYGLSTTLDPGLVTSHSQGLSSLAENTLYHYRVISSSANGSTTSSDYTFTTSGPPVISNVQAVSITSNSAMITWTTNTAADSTVNYGATVSYGNQVTNASLVTNHSILLTGLSPCTNYHYQCKSANTYGTAASSDFAFATSALPTEIIVDEAAATRSGTWNLVSGSGNDNTYRWANSRKTSANATCTWTPAITTAGYYNVYCTYPTATSPTANATFTVNYNGGSVSASFNQANNVNTWQLVAGSVPFAAGTSGNVVLNNLTGETNGTKRVVADAVKFVYVGSSPLPSDVIVDDIDSGATSTGSWTIGTSSLPASYDSSYKFCYNDIATETASYTWTPTLTTTGTYNVYCWYPSGSNRTTAAHYTINHAGGSASATVNQTGTGSQWVQIAAGLTFTAGTSGYVKMDNITGETTGSKVIMADAMKWVYTGGGGGGGSCGDITPPTVSIGAPSAALTRTGPITYTISYSDDVGIAAITLSGADITLNKTGTANGVVAVTGSGLATRTVTISGITGDGTLGISIASGTASDAASNLAPSVGPSATFTVDNTAPTISIGAPSATLTKSGPITYTITYGGADAVTLTGADVTLNKTGSANGVAAVTGSGLTARTVTIGGVTGDGTVGISIAAGTASDNAGNTALAAGPSAVFTVDNTAPTISIGAPSAAQTRSGPITYTVTYGGADAVTLADVSVTLNKTGTANGTVAVTGSGTTTRTVTISGITGNGTLGISIAAGTASDTAGNNAAAAGPSTTFIVDNIAPSISIGDPTAILTKSGPVTYTVTYGGADAVTLAEVNVTLNKTGTANGTVAVTGSGTTTRTVTISGITGNGTLGISIAAGTASDTAGNNAAAAGPSTTFIVDNVAPTISIGDPSAILTKSGPVTYTVTYGGASTVTLASVNVTLNKTGTANGTVAVTGSGTTTRTVTISGITGSGTLGISIAAGTASDTVGNTADAAGPSATFNVDNTAPGAVIVTDEGTWTPSLTTLKATWTAASDGSGSGIAGYEYAIGTSAVTQNIKGWTFVGNVSAITDSSLSLSEGQEYFIQIRAIDNVGLTGVAAASDGITAAPGVNPIGAVWSSMDSVGLSIRDKVVTRALPGMFWLEESDRSAAIKVLSGTAAAQGDKVSVAGVLGISAGQRVLNADVVEPRGTASLPAALGIKIPSLGGKGINPSTPGVTDGIALYNVGLLVRVWGTVTGSDTSSSTDKYFYFDDGSKLSDGGAYLGVRVRCGSIEPPTSGLVLVKGVVGLEDTGTKMVPVIIVTDESDIFSLQL